MISRLAIYERSGFRSFAQCRKTCNDLSVQVTAACRPEHTKRARITSVAPATSNQQLCHSKLNCGCRVIHLPRPSKARTASAGSRLHPRALLHAGIDISLVSLGFSAIAKIDSQRLEEHHGSPKSSCVMPTPIPGYTPLGSDSEA